MEPIPVRIEPANDFEMFIEWKDGSRFLLPYHELRFQCPCASCVNEITGKRMIRKEQIIKDIKPSQVEMVGRYGIRIAWTDKHNTGMYHFDTLNKICHSSAKGFTDAQTQ